ncbi:hypothetical protein Syun_000823 [Stephania yunnanensis]|uniref:Cleavage and polyadenylation specificity factor subunit 2 n=1 Tax=Stephania yunnanensis TaxID=152371 RepID=A0AAP0Q6I0_9MAGN
MSHGADDNVIDPMVIDSSTANPSSDVTGPSVGIHRDIFIDGFVINPDDYVIKEEDMDQLAMLGGADLDNKLDEGSANLILDSKPSKVISNELIVQVTCSLVYMDFEGRSDGRSIKSILVHVAPLKLVLVHGSAEATEHLKQHCLKLVCSQVYAPQIGETIDVTSYLCAYKVQLSEGLMSNVLFKKLGDYEIAWVDAEKRNRDGISSVSENVVADSIRNGKLIPFLIRDGKETEKIRFRLETDLETEIRNGTETEHKWNLFRNGTFVIAFPTESETESERECKYSVSDSVANQKRNQRRIFSFLIPSLNPFLISDGIRDGILVSVSDPFVIHTYISGKLETE